ncbi:MAG: hypothetical protein IJX45_03785 [Spirochaetaceae bacterium]|nr:hypothetical protein [Spirochaetaceae bacterium]
MSKRLNEAKAVRRGAITALIIITILMSGCGNPVGGVENNSVADFVGKSYKGKWEAFSISKENDHITLKIGSGTDDTIGKVVALSQSEHGTVYLLECSQHKNWGAYQYPSYPSDPTKEPHSGCYLPVYVRSITGETVEWTTFYTKVEGKDTACFAAGSKDKATEYLDFSKWDAPSAYSTGTAK